jgi:hypothetical protein
MRYTTPQILDTIQAEHCIQNTGISKSDPSTLDSPPYPPFEPGTNPGYQADE